MKKRKTKLKTFEKLKKEWLKDPVVKRKYDSLELEFALISALIEQRIARKITQKELAAKIKTTQSSIARFESGTYNPTLSYVKKLADALGLAITISAKKI